MRATLLLALFLAALGSGCDPVGLRRVQLQLRAPTADSPTVALDSPETQEALQLLDTVTSRHGFHLAQTQTGFARVYFLGRPVPADGRMHVEGIPCRVRLMSNGILVTFGEPGFLGPCFDCERLFVDVRDTFIKRYGKKNVRSHRLGGA